MLKIKHWRNNLKYIKILPGLDIEKIQEKKKIKEKINGHESDEDRGAVPRGEEVTRVEDLGVVVGLP